MCCSCLFYEPSRTFFRVLPKKKEKKEKKEEEEKNVLEGKERRRNDPDQFDHTNSVAKVMIPLQVEPVKNLL